MDENTLRADSKIDPSDPDCIEKILMYVDEIQRLDEEFIEALTSKLSEEEILWKLPWYQSTLSLSRALKLSESDEKRETFRQDKISSSESAQIDRNWTSFIKLYNLPDKRGSFARWKTIKGGRTSSAPQQKVRRFIVAHLAQGLERSLEQVYRHFVEKYSYTFKGHYSKEELEIIDICIKHWPDKAVGILSCVLARSPRQLYNKVKELHHGKPENVTPRHWTIQMASQLINSLLKHTGLPIEGLKYQNFEKDTWEKVSQDMGYTPVYLKNFWETKLHVQLFVRKKIKFKKLRRQIIDKLSTSSYKKWRDIKWNELVKSFPDGCTKKFIYWVTYNIFRKVPNVRQIKLKEAISLLEELNESARTNKKNNRCLKRLTFNDKEQLEVIPKHDEL